MCLSNRARLQKGGYRIRVVKEKVTNLPSKRLRKTTHAAVTVGMDLPFVFPQLGLVSEHYVAAFQALKRGRILSEGHFRRQRERLKHVHGHSEFGAWSPSVELNCCDDSYSTGRCDTG